MNDSPHSQSAGGFATQRGITYQNRVAAALAVACVSQAPSGMGLPPVPIKTIRCESGEPIGDILLELTDGGFLFLEVKRTIRLPDDRFASLVEQLIKQFVTCQQSLGQNSKPWRRPLRIGIDRLQIITSSESPLAVRKHLAACLERVGSATIPTDLPSLPKNHPEESAFALFRSHFTTAWKVLLGEEPGADQFIQFASVVRIGTVDANQNEADEAHALRTIGESILEKSDSAVAAWHSLIEVVAEGAQTREPLNADAIRTQLQRLKFGLRSSPNYLKDIHTIKKYTRLTIRSMSHLGELSVKGVPIRINREVTDFLVSAVENRSLLIIGEPGAGKSGVLHELATKLDNNFDLLFIAADRISGPLHSELGLANDVNVWEVLRNWTGVGPGFVVIDALDAARGAVASTALRGLMRDIAKSDDSRWRVVASVRTYDLRYGQEIQQIFRVPFGEERLDRFQHQDFPFIRHVSVPRFDPSELAKIFVQSPDIELVYQAASEGLKELLTSPFNLRLVADLLSSNLSHGEISAIQTHMALLEEYWLHRVVKSAAEGTARELTLHELLEAMVADRTLTISKTTAKDAASRPEFPSLCQDGVIVEQTANLHGRNIVGFAHHLLFDYAASRLFIGANLDGFLQLLASQRDLALFLRMSIELLFKEAWVNKREEFWLILKDFASRPTVPSIARIIGPSVIPELAQKSKDLEPLFLAIQSNDRSARTVSEQWIVHVVGAVLASSGPLDIMLWAKFAEQLTTSLFTPVLSAVAQSLVDRLATLIHSEYRSYEAGPHLKRACINILNFLLEQSSRDTWLVNRVITNLMDVMYGDSTDAIAVLRRLITPQEIVLHGAEHGPWIARKIRKALTADPTFVADFYIAIFSYEETSDQQTPMGGSRILALHSNRGQDYRHIYWELSQFFPQFTEKYPSLACDVVGTVINSYVERDHQVNDPPQYISFAIDGAEHRVKEDHSSIWDGATVRDDVQTIVGTFFRRLKELANEVESRELAADLAFRLFASAKYAMTLRRLLLLAAEQTEVFRQIAYSLAVSPSALLSLDLSTQIGNVLPNLFALLTVDERSAIENAIESLPSFGDPKFLVGLTRVRDRLYGCLPLDRVTRPEIRTRIEELSRTDGGLPPNDPPFRTSGVFTRPYSMVDEQRRRGVPVDEPANIRLRESADPVSTFAGRYVNSDPTLEELEQIYRPLLDLRQALKSAEADGAHIETRNDSEATLIAGCAAGAKCDDLDCTSELGRFIKEVLLEGLQSPLPEYNPEYDEQFDKHPSWGGPIQRIEAASGIGALLRHERCVDRELMESLQTIRRDQVPAVRYQLAVRLLALHENHISELWTILEQIASEEKMNSIIGATLYAAVNPLCGKYREESLQILRVVLSRTDLPNDGGDAREWALRIASGLWIWQGDEAAKEIVSPVIAGPGFDALNASRCLQDIRDPLHFDSNPPKPTDELIRQRAFALVETIVSSASTRINRLLERPEPSLRDKDWSDEFQKLAKLVDYAGNQIYFASDTFTEPGVGERLSDAARSRFWHESKAAITVLTETAIPSVAHHLIEILQSFIHYEPTEVFHAIAEVVRSAKGWGYQYESLAVELLVKVIENYLAEYPQNIQEDPRAREELVDILEVFVDAGWPAARRLSYRLEEIFR
jgi:hypothetical protein